MSAVERTAARTLNNPLQARPIVDLVDRLEAETKQTGSQTVLLVSLGSGQGTTEALVLTGTLLGERRRREVLLVDADLKRRGLSAALECLGKEGFADALVTDCMPTSFVEALATRNVRLLPAGRGGDLDSKQAEPRLEAALKSLSEAYGLVLLDGGQAGSELTAALARQADVTYLVVELGVVEAAEAQKALRDLRAAGGRVLGCIAV
jgi:MinD-like ATPase involved in chromosome partitioning or flagellar assembly